MSGGVSGLTQLAACILLWRSRISLVCILLRRYSLNVIAFGDNHLPFRQERPIT